MMVSMTLWQIFISVPPTETWTGTFTEVILEVKIYHQKINKLKSLKVAKSKDDHAVCDVMYDSVCVMLCVMLCVVMLYGDVMCDVVCGDAVW